MRSQRKSFRRKVFCRRNGREDYKKKSAEQREGSSRQQDYPEETDGHWLWLCDEVVEQGCRRLDRRQRRLNSELLRAVEEGAVEKVVRYI
jgi:hypothetical protein